MSIILQDFPPDFRELVIEILDRGIYCRQIPRTIIIEAQHQNTRHLLMNHEFPMIPHHYIYLINNTTAFTAILREVKNKYVNKDNLKNALAYQFIHFKDETNIVLNIKQQNEYLLISNEHVHQDYWDVVKEVWNIFPQMPYFSLNLLSTNVHLPPHPERTLIKGAVISLPLTKIKSLGINLARNLVDLLFPDSRLVSNRSILY